MDISGISALTLASSRTSVATTSSVFWARSGDEMGSAISSPSTRRSGHTTFPVRRLTRLEPSMPGMKMIGGLPEPGAGGVAYICGRFGRSAGWRQPDSDTADAITNRMAAAGKTIVNAVRFVLGGAIMSNPVQDARRELKIIPCFVGTVAHLHLTNIDELHDSDPPWPQRFLALHIDLCYYRRAFMQSKQPIGG